jgi:hypothetical protein
MQLIESDERGGAVRHHARPERASSRASSPAPDRRRDVDGRRSTNPAPARRGLPPARRKVRMPELVVGVLLVTGFALAAVVWQSSSTQRAAALALANDVRRGTTLQPSDFVAVDVASHGLGLVPFADAEKYVGKVTTIDLTAGAPVTADVVTDVLPLTDGLGLVGRRLEPGDYPGGIAVGDRVDIVPIADPAAGVTPALDPSIDPASATSAGAPSGDPASGGPASDNAAATVESVLPLDDAAGAVVVTLRLPVTAAHDVAAASAIRLVRVGG